jgi:hypothetical protein
MGICKSIVDEARKDPAFMKEQKRVCGDDEECGLRECVFPHTRKKGANVKGHYRNLHAPRARAKEAKILRLSSTAVSILYCRGT